jgi:hypothetical protein
LFFVPHKDTFKPHFQPGHEHGPKPQYLVIMLATVLLFIAFLLLLLVSVSVPVTKTIYLFKLLANVGSGLLKSGVSGSVKFGVWGYCFSGVDVSRMSSIPS